MELKLNIEKYKSGIPCLWECGGAHSHKGEALIICASNGEAKKAAHIRKRGNIICGNHALIPIEINDIVISCSYHENLFFIKVYKINSIEGKECMLEVCNEDITSFENAIMNAITKSNLKTVLIHPIFKEYESAIRAAVEKAFTYHCRKAMYIKE